MNITEETNTYSYEEKIQAGVCPVCNTPLSFTDGCKNCLSCLWEACG